MRKIISIFLAILLVIPFGVVPVFAQGTMPVLSSLSTNIYDSQQNFEGRL